MQGFMRKAIEVISKTALLYKMAGMSRPVFRLKNAIPNTSHGQLLVSTLYRDRRV